MEIKHIYLVDIENTGPHNMDESEIKPNSLVVYFTSNHSRRMTNLRRRETFVEKEFYRKITPAPNAMDFVITATLGWFVREYGQSAEYILVSNDKGYDTCIEMLTDEGYRVNRARADYAKYLSLEKQDSDSTDKDKASADLRAKKILSLLTEKRRKSIVHLSSVWEHSTKKGLQNRDEVLERNLRSSTKLMKELRREGKEDTVEFLLWYIKKYQLRIG